MALFGKRDTPAEAPGERGEFPLPPRRAHCSVCAKEQSFTKSWRRNGMVRQCSCCGMPFENPAALYNLVQPVCPKCGEPLEQPNFDYGLCDGCGSKFELIENTKPGLIPNLRQRQERDSHGKSRSVL